MSSLVPYFLLHRRLLLNLDFLQSSYKFFWDFYDNVNKNTTKVCLIFVKTTNTCLDFFAIVNWLFSNWSWCWRWIVSYEHHRLIECYRKSSQILMRLEELTHFIAIGSSHTHFNAIGSAHKFTWWEFSAWLTRCDWKSSPILMQLESLTNLKDERILPVWHVAIGRAHKLWCDWKRSRIYDMKVFRLADMMRLEELTNFPDVSILSGWHVAIGRAHKFWCWDHWQVAGIIGKSAGIIGKIL